MVDASKVTSEAQRSPTETELRIVYTLRTLDAGIVKATLVMDDGSKRTFNRHINPDSSTGGWLESSVHIRDNTLDKDHRLHKHGDTFVTPTAVLMGQLYIGNSIFGHGSTVVGNGEILEDSVVGRNSWLYTDGLPHREIVIIKGGKIGYSAGKDPKDVMAEDEVVGQKTKVLLPGAGSRKLASILEKLGRVEGLFKSDNERVRFATYYVGDRMKYDLETIHHIRDSTRVMKLESLLPSKFTKGIGVCLELSATLALILNEMGYDARLRRGDRRDGRGSHVWVEVKIGGRVYVADPARVVGATGDSSNSEYFFLHDGENAFSRERREYYEDKPVRLLRQVRFDMPAVPEKLLRIETAS